MVESNQSMLQPVLEIIHIRYWDIEIPFGLEADNEEKNAHVASEGKKGEIRVE